MARAAFDLSRCAAILTAFLAIMLAAPLGASEGSLNINSFRGRWIDLSHSFSEDTIYWPTACGFEKTVDFQGMNPKGYFYASNSFRASEHGGTHIDAPFHFAEGKKTVDQIPVEQLIGPAVVVDVSDVALTTPDYLVSISDFEAWESRYGALPKGAIVILKTGFYQFWPDRERYMGTAEKGPEAVARLHFPGLGPEAAEWLVKERDIRAIGIDTPSIDYGQSTQFRTHRILSEANLPAFENVANLGALPARGFFLIALPMKIEGGSGGPVRIVAFLPDAEPGQ